MRMGKLLLVFIVVGLNVSLDARLILQSHKQALIVDGGKILK